MLVSTRKGDGRHCMSQVDSSRDGCLNPVVARHVRAFLNTPLERFARYAGRQRYAGSAS
jgi:hypothetical protein